MAAIFGPSSTPAREIRLTYLSVVSHTDRKRYTELWRESFDGLSWLVYGNEVQRAATERAQELVNRLPQTEARRYIMEKVGSHQNTALHVACQKGVTEMVDFILNTMGEEVHRILYESNGDYLTALHLCKNADCVNSLLKPMTQEEKDDYIKTLDGMRMTAADTAAWAGRLPVVDAIFSQCSEQAMRHLLMRQDEWGQNIFFFASEGHGTEVIYLELLSYADNLDLPVHKVISKEGTNGETSVHYLVIKRWKRCILEAFRRLSLKQRQDALSKVNRMGYTPRSLALIPAGKVNFFTGTKQYVWSFFSGDSSGTGWTVDPELLHMIHFFTFEYTILNSLTASAQIQLSPSCVLLHKIGNQQDKVEQLELRPISDDTGHLICSKVLAENGDFDSLFLVVDVVLDMDVKLPHVTELRRSFDHHFLPGHPKVIIYQLRTGVSGANDINPSNVLRNIYIDDLPPDWLVWVILTKSDIRSCLQRHLETAAESCSVEDSLKKLRDKFRADPDVVSLGPIFSTLGRRITLDSVLHQEARIPPPKQPRLIVGPKPRAQGCCLIISNSYSESSSTESGEALPKRVKIERTDWQIELENAKFTARVQLGLCFETIVDGSREEIIAATKTLVETSSDSAMLVVFILAHGISDREITLSDDSKFDVQTALDELDVNPLQPKLVILQYCRGMYKGIYDCNLEERELNRLVNPIPKFDDFRRVNPKLEAFLAKGAKSANSAAEELKYPRNSYVVFSTLTKCRSRRNLLCNMMRDHMSELWLHQSECYRDTEERRDEEQEGNRLLIQAAPIMPSQGQEQKGSDIDDREATNVVWEYVDSLFLDIAGHIRNDSDQIQQIQRVDNFQHQVMIAVHKGDDLPSGSC